MIIKKLKNKILKAKVISFDIYDTILYRLISANDVFKIVEEIYNKSNTYVSNLAKIRIEAETIARKNISKGEEVSLDEIYIKVREINKNINIKKMKEIEINIEKQIVYVNEEIKDVMNFCAANNKKIIITSDMYLPYELITEILKTKNINYDRLYLSSSCGLKKSTGNIFKLISEELNVDYKDILHIGDNFKSDYIRPKLKGIQVYKTKTQKHNSSWKNLIIDNNFDKKLDTLENFGYQLIGPLMFEFCKYIHNFSKNGNVIFLAREGKFIKQCYDTMYSEANTDYLYISRKSITSAAIYDKKNREKIINMQSINQNETVEEFFNRMTILNELNIEILKKHKIELEENIHKCKDKIANISNEFVIDDSNFNIFNDYLKKFRIKDNTFFVDIGWNGTMQDIMELYLDKKVNGLYLGLRKQRATINKKGFLFDENKPKIEEKSRGMVDFLEVVFSANHGSTIGYKRDKKDIVPILTKNDIDNNILNDVLVIQENAIKFIENNINNYILENIDFSDVIKDKLISYGTNPSNELLELFKTFYTYDEKVKYFLPQKKFIYYIFHMKKFKEDFINSGWKYGFLKKIFKFRFISQNLYLVSYKFKKR